MKGLAAGMDLEMPSSNGRTDAQLVAAVRDGSLDESALDVAAGRVIDLVRKVQADAGAITGLLDIDAHHALAREAAGRSIVLLQNAPVAGGGSLLQLRRDARLAVIGAFAEKPRYQGAGSSMINPTRLDAALDAIRDAATDDVTYAPGFSLAVGVDEAETAALREAAVAAASGADIAVLFLGLPARLESEGFDREDIDLPADQLAVLDAVLAVTENVVVVLSNGGVVALPFAERVPAIVEAWLLGQAGGSATADVLFGDVTPSGKLTETIPLRLSDTPPTSTSRASSGTSATARACSSGTAGTTPAASRSRSRSDTACRTRRSRMRMPRHPSPPMATSRCGSR
ncbi:glycoside hydrolase family 3 C-terminal domain-containing protein [Microbacterium aurum]